MNHIITFYSVSDALHLEKVLKENGFKAAMVPVPRALSASCGYAVEVQIESCEKLLALVKQNKISIEKCYKMIQEGRKRVFKSCS